MALKSFNECKYLLNKDSGTFNGVILFSWSWSVKTRFERILIFFAPTVLYIIDKVGNFGQFHKKHTLRKRVKFAHKNSIYSQYFAPNSQCKACSFSVWDRMKHTFSFHPVSVKKSWNMRAKTWVTCVYTQEIVQLQPLIIHWTHYLFSDWPKAYS